MAKKERIVFIDYIRMVACILVMLVHASESFYAADTSGLAGNVSMVANETNRFWVAFYDGGIARTCVPLFMVVSAFLLVPVGEGVTMRQFYRRRMLRILPPTVAFMLLYTFLPLLWGQLTWEQSISDLKLLPFTFPSMAGHLWFMYPLVSLYLIIPIVSPWLERSSASDERLFLWFFAISTLVPWLTRFVNSDIWGCCFWNPYFGMLYYCSGYLGYLVLAHYIRKHLTWSRSRRMVTGIFCLIAGSVFTAWSFWHAGIPGTVIETPMLEWSWEFCTPNVLCATFGAFLLFTCIDQPATPRFVALCSRLSFGMYLMHLFFLSNIAPIFVNSNPEHPLIHVSLAIPAIAMLSFVCCLATSWFISQIPGCRWIVGIGTFSLKPDKQ